MTEERLIHFCTFFTSCASLLNNAGRFISEIISSPDETESRLGRGWGGFRRLETGLGWDREQELSVYKLDQPRDLWSLFKQCWNVNNGIRVALFEVLSIGNSGGETRLS